MKILILGATGMAGHTIALYLHEAGHEVVAFSRSKFQYTSNINGDVLNFNLLQEIINDGNYDAVVNAIGILNTDAEDNKTQAILLNSYLPHLLSEITQDIKTKVIHMSTDCVFSGKKGSYGESSFKDGDSFYDRTKALGELQNQKDLTFRNSIVGPDMNDKGIGLFNWFMKQSDKVNGYPKAIWTGVTTLTLAKAIESALKNELTGLYNLVNNNTITKFDLLCLFNENFKSGTVDVNSLDNVIVDKSLVNNRCDFDFVVPTYDEMIKEMKAWVYDHKDLYPHYFPELHSIN
jgi:dTDP-4-dehydrorhamnose reductase